MDDAEQGGAATDGAYIPITTNQRLDSIEMRLAALEAQQTRLRLEQLRAEVAGLHQTLAWTIEYIAERDGANVIEHRSGGAA